VTTAEQLRQARGRLTNRLRRQQNQMIELTERVRALEEEVARLSARIAAPSPAEEKAAQLETRLNAWSPQTFSSSLLLGKGAKFGDRVVGANGFDKLVRQVVDLTGTDPVATRRHLQVAYRSVILAEARSLGRIAGSTLNILGKLVTPRLLGPPNGRVLEIGTLFGVFGGALVHELSRAGGHVELTVVDPLEGVQLQGGHVPTADVSGTPVSEPVVRHNLEAAGLHEPRFRIVEGYSTDEAVRHAVGDRTYGLVIVDGDHSEEGVKADLEWVESLVEPGTIVVLDDYGDARWPGVQAATDKHLMHSQVLLLAGLVSTSAYLIAATP
jgi:predicted O-methyltransferase YrrM